MSTILHYGDSDFVVPLVEAQNIAARRPQIEMHIYPGAKHAFENSEQDSYDADAGDPAWARAIVFLDRLTL